MTSIKQGREIGYHMVRQGNRLRVKRQRWSGSVQKKRLKTRFMWVDDVIVVRNARVPHNISPFLKGDLSEFEFEFKSLNVSEAKQGDTGDRDK